MPRRFLNCALLVLFLTILSQNLYSQENRPEGSGATGIESIASSTTAFPEKSGFNDLFLSRVNAPYSNYSWIDYRNYRENIPIYKQYDSFGNYLTEGYDVLRLEEFRTRAPDPGSVLIKGRFYQNWLKHLVIASDAYKGWTTRLTIGDAIRTTLTPLTLDNVRFNGVRWDAGSNNNRFTGVLSRISDPIKINIYSQFTGDLTDTKKDGVYLMGGHWESHLGDILVLGTTYVNLHRFDSMRNLSENNRKGVAPQSMKAVKITVRFEDDSPEDGIGGVAVFDVVGVFKSKVGNKIITEVKPPSSVTQSSGVVQVSRHLEASGQFIEKNQLKSVFIEYVFDKIPDNVIAGEFSALVANDYRILIKQNHSFITTTGTEESRETSYVIIKRAPGNVRDFSNKRTVTFDYGIPTGVSIYGLDGEINLIGIKMRGEIEKSTNYYQYPVSIGRRSSFDDMAGWLTVTKDIDRNTVGLELFQVGPKYTTYDKSGETFYFNEPRQAPNLAPNVLVNNNKYPLVEDNDDLDEWPDDWVDDWDTTTPTQFLRSDAGIFPGFDADADGIPDNNRNQNGIPDYKEPFLMYFVDPDELQYGDDFNNNGIVDAWEDDDLPNYPYYKDEKGKHGFFILRPVKGLELTFGDYSVNQIAGGGRNKVKYGRLKFTPSLPNRFYLEINHETKRVRDDISNDWFRFELQEGVEPAAYTQILHKDPLEMKNSLVNRGLFYTTYTPIRRLNLIGKFRYEFNSQKKSVSRDGTSQPEDRNDFIGLVGKSDYTFILQRLSIMPRIKVLYEKIKQKSVERPTKEELITAPILRLDYQLMPKTTIEIGFQGFPGFGNRFKDMVDKTNNRTENHFLVLVSNKSDFEGYKIGTEIGWQRTSIDYAEAGRRDAKFSKFFVRIVAGVTEMLR